MFSLGEVLGRRENGEKERLTYDEVSVIRALKDNGDVNWRRKRNDAVPTGFGRKKKLAEEGTFPVAMVLSRPHNIKWGEEKRPCPRKSITLNPWEKGGGGGGRDTTHVVLKSSHFRDGSQQPMLKGRKSHKPNANLHRGRKGTRRRKSLRERRFRRMRASPKVL